MIETRDINPNGLPSSMIACRPEPYIGMLVYLTVIRKWWFVPVVLSKPWKFSAKVLLAGEPGCPWPPPKRFRHTWREGDRAWVYDQSWVLCEYSEFSDSFLSVSEPYRGYERGITPAIYIPEGEE